MATPLRAFDRGVTERLAARWRSANPGASPTAISRGDRLAFAPARAAFAIATEAGGASLGAAPCLRCGRWTHSWCETCRLGNLGPICTECDNLHLLCQLCEEAREDWQVARATRETQDGPPTVEVQGFFDENHRWQILDPPLQISLDNFDPEQSDLGEFVSSWLQTNHFGSDGQGSQDGRRAGRDGRD